MGSANCNFKMSRTFIFIAVVALTQLSRTYCFKFTVARDLFSTKTLELEEWCFVEVIQTGVTENDVEIKVDIPFNLPFSDVHVFFASDSKEILEVNLNRAVRGKFYAAPYKIVKEMEGENPTITESDRFRKISGNFPSSWLPRNCNKISATVKNFNDRYYNYYSIQNFKISIPDLMVIEEFKSFNINQK